MSDFNGEDYDFAVGSVLGLRSWSMDSEGRLRGVTHPAIWTPGENVSFCKQPGGRYTPCPKAVEAARALHIFYGTCADPTCVQGRGHFVAATERHHFDPSCECGFWAYNEDDFVGHGAVVGLIEGYGKTTIGTRGFRSEKARIVALCREVDDYDVMSLSKWLRLKQLYPAAKFYDERDEMAEAHGGVLKTWGAVDEDFWTEPEPEVESPLSSRLRTLSNQMQVYSQALTYYPRFTP